MLQKRRFTVEHSNVLAKPFFKSLTQHFAEAQRQEMEEQKRVEKIMAKISSMYTSKVPSYLAEDNPPEVPHLAIDLIRQVGHKRGNGITADQLDQNLIRLFRNKDHKSPTGYFPDIKSKKQKSKRYQSKKKARPSPTSRRTNKTPAPETDLARTSHRDSFQVGNAVASTFLTQAKNTPVNRHHSPPKRNEASSEMMLHQQVENQSRATSQFFSRRSNRAKALRSQTLLPSSTKSSSLQRQSESTYNEYGLPTFVNSSKKTPNHHQQQKKSQAIGLNILLKHTQQSP